MVDRASSAVERFSPERSVGRQPRERVLHAPGRVGFQSPADAGHGRAVFERALVWLASDGSRLAAAWAIAWAANGCAGGCV